MKIEIIGTESLGVRGLCCSVEFGNRKIIIDPGVSLGYIRNGLKPHPLQIAVGDIIRSKIIEEIKTSTDIIFSHFHGDHIPLVDPNPYQLSIDQLGTIGKDCRIWAKKEDAFNSRMRAREESLIFGLDHDIDSAKGRIDENLSFSAEVPHGISGTQGGTVVMTCIEADGTRFLHASDIQFLDDAAVKEIVRFSPDIVLASGPPIYLEDAMRDIKDLAWNNLLETSRNVETLILDHHILRCSEGVEWLERLKAESYNTVCCGADYMGKNRHFLEALREKLYMDIPVEDGWHD
ncbi:MAG: MBL fold metallo-hydrolase, partial [Bacillota bacterium]